MSAPTYAIGSLVTARGREWVVLPGDPNDRDLLLLRPLGGTEGDATGLYLPVEGDTVQPASFGYPDPARNGDSTSARLLRDAVRLNFRAGAGPFRSLGRIAVEPRPYQIVPLLMALRLDPIRLLIADDVGIGKTVEAGLIARELLDRGEIDRLAVVCPPHLCEQWQRELASKFHIDAVVVRPGTVTRLERGLRHDESLFDVYPFVVVSIDYIKSDRRRADFVRACPSFVIVDEAHTAAAGGATGGQHQRYELVRELAADPDRHLILATATPHSGIEASFRSLIGLLDPAFEALDPATTGADDPLRRRLAQHLIQRRRGDIESYLDERTTFPERKSREITYTLSADYQRLFDRVFDYATELVASSEGLSAYRRRVCWWAALALLRCVGSSPAAAAETLRRRAAGMQGDEESELAVADLDVLGERSVLDMDASEAADQDDVVPGADTVLDDRPEASERRRLQEMAKLADQIRGDGDRKLAKLVEIARGLLDDGCHPIVFCRYISTAEYVAAELKKQLAKIEVDAVTGRLPADERTQRVLALGPHDRRVLVATDCLSEGINLQDAFDAVIHYDLAWNPTRHEQREGRVDRFGQQAAKVRTVLLYGENNRVDGAILHVLLRKAETIRKELGISVPVPADNGKVLDAIFESLFLRSTSARQLELGFAELELQSQVRAMDDAWTASVDRQRRSRTIFAQATIRPELVRAELDETHKALGDAGDVERFVRDACTLLDAPLGNVNGNPLFNPVGLPPTVRMRIPIEKPVPVGFRLPVAEGVAHLARTSAVVEALATYLVDTALDTTTLDPGRPALASRCGVMQTSAVPTRTTLLLLRARIHLDAIRRGEKQELLAEEVILAAYRGRGETVDWLSEEEANTLLDAKPSGNLTAEVRQLRIEETLADVRGFRQAEIAELAEERATEVRDAHTRVRDAARQKGVQYQARAILPADVLGLYIYIPKPVA